MMKMGVYVLDETAEKFRFCGIAMEERFWPMCEPILMENGNYIMAGIYVASDYFSSENTSAVAISHGSDVLHWDMIKLEYSENVKVWGECSVIVNGSHISLYCREYSRKLKALYAGKLSTGQHYLICSCAEGIRERNPLTIALTKKGEESFSKILMIDGRNPYENAAHQPTNDVYMITLRYCLVPCLSSHLRHIFRSLV